MPDELKNKNLQVISARMREEWDRRVSHDYRYWMSDGVDSDRTMWEAGKRDFSILIKELDPTELARQTALEIGCGVGRLMRPAAQVFSRAIGIDVSAEAIAQAKCLLADLPNVDLILGNGVDLVQIAQHSIDFAFTFAAMSSMPVAVIANYLSELSRVVKPNGLLRLQVFLGREQDTAEEDTLAIRVFTKARFCEALHAAGFAVEYATELELPFEVSNHEEGIIAHIVSARRMAGIFAVSSDVQQHLVERSESAAGAAWQGSRTEYLMALARAKQQLDAGQAQQALAALEFAVAVYAQAEPDVRELLAELRRLTGAVNAGHQHGPTAASMRNEVSAHSQHAPVYAQNLEILRRRFPELESLLEKTVLTEAVSVSFSAAGEPVISCQGLALSHREKPERSGASWAERALNVPDIRSKGALVVAGFGDAYHLRALIKMWGKEVHVAEPSLEVLKAALTYIDCREVIAALSSLSVSLDGLRAQLKALNVENAEMLIHPQTQVLHPEFAAEFRRIFRTGQGFGQLRPNFAVVGPFWGGSLPIAEYTVNALRAMKQRVSHFALERYHQGFVDISEFLRQPARRSAVENQYVEMVSQIVLEGVSERPVDILICLAQAPLSGRVLTELRQRGVITVMWFVEDCRRFTTWQQISRYYDYMFLIQKDEFPRLVEQAGAGRAVYLPVGCDPAIHRPLQLSDEEKAKWGSQLSFVGAGYNNRRYMFSLLAQHDFKIWGTQWPACMPFTKLVQEGGRRLAVEEYVKIFNASTINLNLHSSAERDGVEPDGDFINPRTFELAACGAFQLVDQRKYLAENFTPGVEIADFADEKEMLERGAYYLAHPAERQRIIDAGRKRALAEHTYQHRLQAMLDYIYADRFEDLKARVQQSPWAKTFEAAKPYPELIKRFNAVYERGEEPTIESLAADIQTGKGALSETEQKLLFLHHIRSQISHVRKLRKEGE